MVDYQKNDEVTKKSMKDMLERAFDQREVPLIKKIKEEV